MARKAYLACALLIASACAGAMPPCSVGHIRPDTDIDARDAYFLELLELALRQTELDFGPCVLREAPVRMSQSRAIASMQEGRFVDVVWTMTSPDREATMLAVRVPLLMGLMGVRVPVVSADRPPKTLAGASTANDLQALTAAQGHDWPDTAILRANELPVDTTSSYESLFRMLAHGRVDYLPRSITEIASEKALYARHALKPMDRPLIAYYAPNYFFVEADNLRLALRLEVGLRRAIEDGSYEALFLNHPANRAGLDLLDRVGDRIIWLKNPYLPEDTPVDREVFWYQPVFRQAPPEVRPAAPAATQ